MCKIEILMSAMHQTDLSLAERSNVQTDMLIINQCDHNGYDEKMYNGHRIRMISTTDRGVSKSRNMAVDNTMGDICIMADDDEVFSEGYPKVILAAYNEKPDADMIAFNVIFRDQSMKTKTINEFRKSPRMQSYGTCGITFKRKAVLDKGIRFNENFGPGSGMIAAGEDSVWCRDAVKKKLTIYQHPFYIAEAGEGDSTWFKGYTKHFFYDRGAYLHQVNPKSCRLMKYYYIYRFWGKCEISMIEQIYWMNAGIRGFSKGLSYDSYIKKQKNE